MIAFKVVIAGHLFHRSAFIGRSIETYNNTISFSFAYCCKGFTWANEARQGPHQVAQISIKITLPKYRSVISLKERTLSVFKIWIPSGRSSLLNDIFSVQPHPGQGSAYWTDTIL